MRNVEIIKKVFRNDLIEGCVIVVIFIALVYVSMLFTSCASNDALSEKALLQQPALSKSEKLNNELFQKRAELTKSLYSSDYKVGPGDLLEIQVFDVKELQTAVRVSSQGFIKLPIGDMINAGGCTVGELESRIAESLKKYMVQPMVSVFVKEYKSQQISVLGYVKTPGIYFATRQESLLDLLSMAGGVNPEGADTCFIQRTSVDQSGKQKTENYVIDLNALLTNGQAELNIPVMAGDIINVPKGSVFFVGGAIGGPGLYPLKGKVTLVEAISMARGLNYEASHSNIKIYRDNGKPQREIITADFDDILAGKSRDITLADKDIIVVGSNIFKSFIKDLAGGVNYGVVSAGKAGYGMPY